MSALVHAFFPALSFAHRARCAAAMRALAPLDILRLGALIEASSDARLSFSGSAL